MNCGPLVWTFKVTPPHRWAKGTGADFTGKLPLHHGVTVVYGDVVDDDAKEFGILSGDDLMLRYSTEIADVERAVFAIGGVDGILRVPISKAGPDDLIGDLESTNEGLKVNMQQILT